jgi:hypothetical protein
MVTPTTSIEVKKILTKTPDHWLRLEECAKKYSKGNSRKKASFQRWRTKIEKDKIKDFRIIKLPGDVSFIGLGNSDPKQLLSVISEDPKLAESIKSGFGLFEWLDLKEEGKAQTQKEIYKEQLLEKIDYEELVAKTYPKEFGFFKKLAKKDRELYKELYGNRPQSKKRSR